MAKGFLVKTAVIATGVVAVTAIVVTNPTLSNVARSSDAYWFIADNIAMPILRRMDPETAHSYTIKAVKNNLAPVAKPTTADTLLQTKVWGLDFANPIGVAAGFDKQAVAMDGLLKLGFGFVEVGGVTPQAQPGNPRPRMFRLQEDQAVINRFGLNSEGQEVVAERLQAFKTQTHRGIVGVNIAKNTSSDDLIGDYKQGVRNLGGHVDFIVLNVSCPNVAWTNSVGDDEMAQMVCAVKQERDQHFTGTQMPPLLLKLAPNMDDDAKKHMAAIAMQCGVDGLVVANTTSERADTLLSKNSKETGGLSGAPVKQAALQTLRDMYRYTDGKIPLIGVGGIASGEDAYERIRAGASLLEVYTALVYQGPGLLPKIKRDLTTLLQRDGYQSVAEAVGVDVQRES